MPRNSATGTYTAPSNSFNPATANTVISEADWNATLADMSTALAHTTSATRALYPTLGQAQDQAFTWGGTAGGSADARTISLTPAITSYATGLAVEFINGAAANTGAATLAINGLAATAIRKGDGTVALAAGDLPANAVIRVRYDGTVFRLVAVGIAGIGAQLIGAADAAAVRTAIGATATGSSLITAADAAAARTAIGAITASITSDFLITKDAPEYRATDTSTSISGGFNVDGTVANRVFLGSFTNHDVSLGTNNAERVTISTAGVVNVLNSLTVAGQTVGVWNRSASVATTSGTNIDVSAPGSFTARRVTLILDGVSTNGSSILTLRLRTGGVVDATGYAGGCREEGVGSTQDTTGIAIVPIQNATALYSGRIVLDLLSTSSNTWAASGVVARENTGFAGVCYGAYKKTLSGAIDGVRLTTTAGDTFDAGNIAVIWE